MQHDPLKQMESGMPKECQRADLIRAAPLIIVDECPMAGRRILDAIQMY